MPSYLYKTQSGYEKEILCKYQERPESIEISYIEDNVLHVETARPVITGVARLSSWSDWAGGEYGLQGRYSKTFNTVIQDEKHHQRLCDEHGVRKVRDLKRLEEIESGLSDRDEAQAIRTAKQFKYNELTAGVTDMRGIEAANEAVYGQDEKEIAARAHTTDILHRIPTARAAVAKAKELNIV